jgi:hypothetical protein
MNCSSESVAVSCLRERVRSNFARASRMDCSSEFVAPVACDSTDGVSADLTATAPVRLAHPAVAQTSAMQIPALNISILDL